MQMFNKMTNAADAGKKWLMFLVHNPFNFVM